MKGKITIVLLSLALVFGMLAASCDNGDLPDRDEKDALTLVAYDATGNADGLPVTDITKSPTKLSGKALWKKVYGSSERSLYNGTYIQTYIIDKVTPKASYSADTETNAKKQAIAAKYKDLPIVIKDPRL